jgi:hypothetical protein
MVLPIGTKPGFRSTTCWIRITLPRCMAVLAAQHLRPR